jgi:dihydrofolate reductase
MISIIVAVAENMGIGKNNDLLWHLPEDLKRFKRLTTGKSVIMGKKTWESLPRRPLPGRKNIVITDDKSEVIEGSVTAYSINDAVEKCAGDGETFIIGGGSIYRQFMSIADRLYITHVHKVADADIFFPEIDLKIWKVAEKEETQISGTDGITYTNVIYERK